MVKIFAPNKRYTGVSASVPFAAGVGETDDPYLINWFRAHGYTVEEQPGAVEEQPIETDDAAAPIAAAEAKRSSRRSAAKKDGE